MHIRTVLKNIIELTPEEAGKASQLSNLWSNLIASTRDANSYQPESYRLALTDRSPEMSNGVDECIKAGDNVNQAAPHGVTPLMVVAAWGNMKETISLIKAGADLEAQDERGTTPLIYAFEQLQMGTIAVLVQAGANINPDIKDEKLAKGWEQFKSHPHNKDWFERLRNGMPALIDKNDIPTKSPVKITAQSVLKEQDSSRQRN